MRHAAGHASASSRVSTNARGLQRTPHAHAPCGAYAAAGSSCACAGEAGRSTHLLERLEQLAAHAGAQVLAKVGRHVRRRLVQRLGGHGVRPRRLEAQRTGRTSEWQLAAACRYAIRRSAAARSCFTFLAPAPKNVAAALTTAFWQQDETQRACGGCVAPPRVPGARRARACGVQWRWLRCWLRLRPRGWARWMTSASLAGRARRTGACGRATARGTATECVLACSGVTPPPSGTSADTAEYVTLRSGARMPRVGFGTAGLGERTGEAVRSALAAGYRLLDSAQAREWYREDLVGEALAATALPREDVFVTTKIHPRHLGYEQTAARVAHSLHELHTDRVDLLLLHYPSCWGDLCGGVAPAGTWRESWRALEAAKAAGQASALGVSNFDAAQLLELLAWAKEPPDVVQAHSDPFSQARCAPRRPAMRPGSCPPRHRTGSCSGCARSTAWCSRHTARWGCSGGARAITATPCCMRPWWKPPPWRTRSRPRRWCCDGRCTKDRRVHHSVGVLVFRFRVLMHLRTASPAVHHSQDGEPGAHAHEPRARLCAHRAGAG